jgi:chaperone BCS1
VFPLTTRIFTRSSASSKTQERVWKRTREFVVTAKNSQRKWAVQTASDPTVVGAAEYVPTYNAPQLFRWKGYWLEVKRGSERSGAAVNGVQQTGRVYLTYVLQQSAASTLQTVY